MAPIPEKSKVLLKLSKALYNLPLLLHLWPHSLVLWPSHILLQAHCTPHCSANTVRHTLASGPLHFLFPLPGMLFPKKSALLVLLLHLPRKASPSCLIQNITLYPNFQISMLITIKPIIQFTCLFCLFSISRRGNICSVYEGHPHLPRIVPILAVKLPCPRKSLEN